jgi:hypothetical protein
MVSHNQKSKKVIQLKKLLILPLLLLSIFSITTIEATTNYEYEYTKYAEASDYERIEKYLGKWYGVIQVTNTKLEYVDWVGSPGINNLYIQFDRDVELLDSIKIDYVTEDYCSGINAWLIGCTRGFEESYEGTSEIYNKSRDGSLLEILTLDTITTTVIDDYDYVIFMRDTVPYKNVDVVEFTYILTAAEIEELKLDIQEQYESEFDLINDNDILSDEKKEVMILQLNTEYEEYDVSYGELMTSDCVGDAYSVDSDNSTSDSDAPLWVQNIINTVIAAFTAILSAFLAVSVIGIIAYMLIKWFLKLTGETAIYSIKVTTKAGAWWGKQFATGIIELLNIIVSGIKKFPLLTIILFIIIIVLLFII